jgi:hypothetical protein
VGKCEGKKWDYIIKMIFFKKQNGDVESINLPLDRDKWRAVLHTVMNLLVA